MLDAPVARELVPADLDRSGHQVRLVVGPPRRPLPGSPLPEQGHPAEHGGLAGARRRRAQVFAASGEFHRSARMCTQRASSSAVCGYSSLSIMFLSSVRSISRWTSGSTHVWQNVARFCRELPSSGVVVDDLVGVPRILLRVGDPVLGHRYRQVVRCEHVILQRVADGVPGVQHRGSPWRRAGSPTWSATGTGTRAGPGRRSPAARGAPGGPAGTTELTSLGSSGPRIASTNGTVVWIRNWPIVELSSCWSDRLEEAESGLGRERAGLAEVGVEDDDRGRDQEQRLDAAEHRAQRLVEAA